MEPTLKPETQTLRLFPAAVALGAGVGVIAAAFIWAVTTLKDLVWPHHGTGDHSVAIVIACVVGGVLVGVINLFAERRRHEAHDLTEAFADAQNAEVTSPPSFAVISGRAGLGIASLGFGGPLGPEAPLIALSSQLASRLAGVLRVTREQAVKISMASALGALFVAPLAGVAVQAESDSQSRTAIQRARAMGPEILAAVVAFIVFIKLLPESDSHPFEAPGSLAPGIGIDLLWCALAAVLAAGVGRLIELLVPRARAVAVRRLPGGPVVLGAASGLLLGASALISPLILFSGHHETQGLLDGGHSTPELVGLSLLKVGVVVVVLAGGWFGGQIFPLAFAGAAIALAFGQVVDSPATLALAASGYVAACVVNLRKPVLVLVIFMFLFPPSTWLAMAIAMAVGSLLISKEPAAQH